MVVYENAQLFNRFHNAGQAIFQLRKNGFERVDLNQVQKLLLALDVVIQPRQRNAARPADVAYRSAFVTLLAENLRGVAQNHLKFFLALGLDVYKRQHIFSEGNWAVRAYAVRQDECEGRRLAARSHQFLSLIHI